MVRAGCVFVAGIHPSRTWTSGSFESVRWNACVHRLDLGLYSIRKSFLGNGVWTKEKSPLPENFPRGGSNPRHCGQRAQTPLTSYSAAPPTPPPPPAPTPYCSPFFHTRLNAFDRSNKTKQKQPQKKKKKKRLPAAFASLGRSFSCLEWEVWADLQCCDIDGNLSVRC